MNLKPPVKVKAQTEQVQDLYRAGPRNIFLVVLDISAAELLNTLFYPAAEELQNYLQMPCFIVKQTCNRDAADLLLPCCRGAVESPVDATYQI